jgi:hypothetical protein
MSDLSAGYLDPGLRSLTRRLRLGKAGVGCRKSSETFLGCLQHRACLLDIDLVSELGAIYQNGHDVVCDLGKTAAHRQKPGLSAAFVAQPAGLERGKEGDMIRQHAEFTNCARSGDLVYFLVEEQTFRSDNAEMEGFCHKYCDL